jgi:hypothetical protein
LLSVPPLVKIISAGFAPRKEATLSLASSTAERACWPKEWMLEGFPKVSLK